MISKDFFQALDDFERERKISKTEFIKALETALTSAYKKKYWRSKTCKCKIKSRKKHYKSL